MHWRARLIESAAPPASRRLGRMKGELHRHHLRDELLDTFDGRPVGDEPGQAMVMINLGVDRDALFTHSPAPASGADHRTTCVGLQRRIRFVPFFLISSNLPQPVAMTATVFVAPGFIQDCGSVA